MHPRVVGSVVDALLSVRTYELMVAARTIVSVGTACLLGVSGYSYISGNSWFFQRVAMPLLSRLDTETAHLAAVYVAAKGMAPRDLNKDPQILASTILYVKRT